ncbi:PilW family protein [Variovorax sp. YR216]|uniref:PilW family protein n=1 Tax=Variovorax sp. YR216 TaxID=1882828 RepID=UPI0008944571|nr:PilW family protein [Variovorax sp. YR216]SEB12117.1 type IV pilus assembly protein PilW [Variovorax sp. YR216]
MRKSNFKSTGQGGFTLVELMVGLVLGMLTVLVITQVLVLAEGKKRSVAMGSDAQVNGAMALYTIQREIQMAGYGATQSLDALGCPVHAQFDTGAPFTFTLAPVIINDGANGAPDTITILRGRSAGFSIPIALAGAHTATDNHFSVNASFGTTAGTWMIAVPTAQDATHWCSLFSVTNDTSDVTTTLSPTVVPHVLTSSSKWNQNSVLPAAGYVKGDYLLNMGSFVSRTYSINTTNNAEALQVADLSLANGLSSPQDLYPQIVNLQALYGKGTVDPSGNVIVDTYDNVTPLTNADWRRVVAIRIAVVARSAEYEKDIVTTTANAPQWDVGSTATITGPTTTTCNGSSKCIALKVNQLTDWQHYRYKVYDTIVPLRNVLWNS